MGMALISNGGAEATGMRGRLAAMIGAGVPLTRIAVETGASVAGGVVARLDGADFWRRNLALVGI